MTPHRLLSGLFPRWLSLASAVLFLPGRAPCPAQPAPPAPPLLLRPQTLRLTWQPSPSAGVTGYRLYSYTAGNFRVSAQTNTLDVDNVTNLVLTNWPRAKWFFAVTALAGDAGESDQSDLAEWPPLGWPPTNHVVTVLAATAAAASLDGPWVTNTAILFQATNPPGMQFWRQAGLSITIMNF